MSKETAAPICRINEFLGIDESELTRLGIYNSFIGTDSRLFLDPFLFESLPEKHFLQAREKIKNYFSKVIKLLSLSKAKEDRPWRAAVKLLLFKENAGLALGYGDGTTSGSAIGPELAKSLANSACELMELGINDPEIFELVGLFTEDFGPDRLSDMTARILIQEIMQYTSDKAKEILGINPKIQFVEQKDGTRLPIGPNGRPLLFLPKAALRDLPVAQSFEDIGAASAFNEELRARYNRLLGPIMEAPKAERKKEKIKEFLFEDPERLRVLSESYGQAVPDDVRYDFTKDPAGEDFFYKSGKELATSFIIPDHSKDLDGIRAVARGIVSHFKRAVETHAGWELLHNDDGTPRTERSSQRLFYVMALDICQRLDIDIIREPSGGRGALDFKFTTGFFGGVAVELKLTSNSHLADGLIEQLPIYADVERCSHAIYVVIDVTEKSTQLPALKKVIEEAEKRGEKVPDVVVVDARPKPTASKVRIQKSDSK